MSRFFYFALGCAVLSAPCAVFAQSVDDAVATRQQQLQAQLNDIESQITVQQGLLTTAQGQHQTLQTQLDAVNAQIKKTQLQIQAITLTISQLNGNIGAHNQTLSELSAQLAAEKESLAQIMRQTQMIDDYSVINVAFGAQSVSDLFKDLDAFTSIKSSLADSFNQIQKTSSSTEKEKEALESRLAEQQQLQSVQQLAKQSLQSQQQDRQTLITKTKGVEANYQKLIVASLKTAAQIRTELFQLAGGAGQISLPVAITLAKQAGSATGVRPAFILAILKQETNLGANVGQCLLTNSPNKGNGKGKNTGTPISRVMKGTRDVDPFMDLTSALGLDWTQMPVSCPQSTGYGGAMGPAQFIPSTWMGTGSKPFSARVAKLAGHEGIMANPWNNLDAFTAIGLYMSDLGADAQTNSAERVAALHYFAGGNWSNPAFSFYGDGVMRYASDFQQEINILGGN